MKLFTNEPFAYMMHKIAENKALKTLLFFVLFFCISIGVTLSLLNGFRIQNIYIEGEHVSFDIDQSKITRNLLFFPSEKVRQMLLKESPLVKDIQIRKIYPSSIKFIVIQRIPKARLVTRDQIYIIDDEGYVIGVPDKFTKTLVPLYFDVPMQQIGEKMKSEGVTRALQILISFPTEYTIVKIEESEMQSIRVEIQQLDIFFPQDGDIVEHIRTLQTLFTGFRIKGVLPAHIDLRFGKPIVR
mgnify:CR=1 FL=1